MKRLFISLLLLSVTAAFAADTKAKIESPIVAAVTTDTMKSVVVVNYETVYAKWTVAVAFSDQTKTALDAINTKLTVKTGTRDAMVKQANELANTKPKDEAEAKQVNAQLAALQTDFQALQKEIQTLQDSPELRKQVNDRQTELRTQLRSEVARQAAAVNATIVLDASALNAYGLPVVLASASAKDITEAVIKTLNSAGDSPTVPSK
jgi:Skp family chaperone for outer membrane proteins